MKITLESMSELLSELQREHNNVHDGTIRVRQISTEINEVVREISFVVTAVVADQEGNGYLLRYAEDCGNDVSPSNDGSQRREAAIDILTEECDKIGLHIRSGEIEL